MKKGFIAAPLLGAIIFLAAVLFTSNISKIEVSDTSKVVNEAYHNRVVSLLEIYRTDLAAIFRETVSRNIQKQLLEPGWVGFAIPAAPDDAKRLTYTDIRKQRCEYVRTQTIYPACPIPPSTGAIDANNYRYGIPQWVSVATKKMTFESITFEATNPDQSKELNPDISTGTQTDAEKLAVITRYLDKCNKLISKNIFDCQQFENEGAAYECKDPDTNAVIPGCEQGTFLIKVRVRDKDVYPYLPRVTGDDGFGNVVRSGAIADKDFYLPINIRLFKYDDYALRFYNKVAYGDAKDSQQSPAKDEGIVDGLCNGGAECQRTPAYMVGSGFNGQGYGTNFDSTQRDNAIKDIKKSFYDGAYANGAQVLNSLKFSSPSENIDFYIRQTGSGSTSSCVQSDGSIDNTNCKTLRGLGANFDSFMPDPVTTQTSGTTIKVYSFYTSPQLTIHVIDSHAAYRSVGSKPNDVSYAFNLKHS